MLNPWNIDGLEELESENGARVYNILQLRLHPSLIELKQQVEKQVEKQKKNKKYDIDLTYLYTNCRHWIMHWQCCK